MLTGRITRDGEKNYPTSSTKSQPVTMNICDYSLLLNVTNSNVNVNKWIWINLCNLTDKY